MLGDQCRDTRRCQAWLANGNTRPRNLNMSKKIRCAVHKPCPHAIVNLNRSLQAAPQHVTTKSELDRVLVWFCTRPRQLGESLPLRKSTQRREPHRARFPMPLHSPMCASTRPIGTSAHRAANRLLHVPARNSGLRGDIACCTSNPIPCRRSCSHRRWTLQTVLPHNLCYPHSMPMSAPTPVNAGKHVIHWWRRMSFPRATPPHHAILATCSIRLLRELVRHCPLLCWQHRCRCHVDPRNFHIRIRIAFSVFKLSGSVHASGPQPPPIEIQHTPHIYTHIYIYIYMYVCMCCELRPASIVALGAWPAI